MGICKKTIRQEGIWFVFREASAAQGADTEVSGLGSYHHRLAKRTTCDECQIGREAGSGRQNCERKDEDRSHTGETRGCPTGPRGRLFRSYSSTHSRSRAFGILPSGPPFDLLIVPATSRVSRRSRLLINSSVSSLSIPLAPISLYVRRTR